MLFLFTFGLINLTVFFFLYMHIWKYVKSPQCGILAAA